MTTKRILVLIRLAVLSGVAIILLAAPAAGQEELYWARPDSQPEWAGQGNFRFIRVDGGGIESRKAERTWWGENFSVEEKEVLSNIYDTHFEKMLGLLKRAEFNWIWVTWSNGWSLEDEKENRELLAKAIARCHQEGIRVTAYLSASNMFWKSAFRDDPETKRFGLWRYGIPLFYAGLTKHSVHISWERRLADIRQPEWRAYLVTKAGLAVDAGVDAIFFDNIIGDTPGMKLLLSEVQRMAETKARETGRPKALVYANVHLDPYRFEINDQCDLIWEEAGKDTPGVWPEGWQVGNVRKIKFLNAEKQAWQPLMFENDLYHCGPRETCIPSPTEQKLSMAEAYAFGAAYSRNIEGRFLNGLIREEPDALSAWSAVAQYNRFFSSHSYFYNRVMPVARIAVMSEVENNSLADYLIKANVAFETKVFKHLGKGVPLKYFKALVIPFAVGRLQQEQKTALGDFIAGGGKIFYSDPKALAGELGIRDQAGLLPIPEPTLERIQAGEPVEDFIERVESAAGGRRLALTNRGYLVTNVTKKVDDDSFIIHFINYQHDLPADHVKVKLDLSDFSKDLSRFELKLFSPDDREPEVMGVSRQGGILEFTIRQIQHYAVAVISSKPM